MLSWMWPGIRRTRPRRASVARPRRHRSPRALHARTSRRCCAGGGMPLPTLTSSSPLPRSERFPKISRRDSVEFKTLRYEVSERILTITLNRPEVLNAFTVEMANELIEAFRRAGEDDAVGAIIVTGTGKAFCAG